ncbi:MAG: glycosyltransferase family 4 protein [Chloroflexota bacterium]|nr:glycosyltransferase family 4 protein [Chloroflexota bacterium]
MSQLNRRLSILHIILALKPTNGQYNEHCLPLMDERDITICTYFKSDITPPSQITLFDGNNTLMGFFRILRAALVGKRHDIIHVHTPHAGVLLLLTLLLTGLYKKLIPSTVHTVQNSFENFKLRNQLLFIPSFAFFRYMVFCSNASYESFPAFFKWLAGNRMRVVQNAVDLERIDRLIENKPLTQNDDFTIATVGLIEIKNPLAVLDAFNQSDGHTGKLVFLGEGIMRSKLSQRIVSLELQKQVELTGMVPRDQVFQYFSRADLFVSASRGEGLPVAVMEAMACRRPVVLSDIAPHLEIVRDVDFIPLINPDDVTGFASAIKRYREMTALERIVLGEKCRQLIEEQFSLPVMHAGYAAIYSEITGNHILISQAQRSDLNQKYIA